MLLGAFLASGGARTHANDLGLLSDEFGQAGSLAQWSQRHALEVPGVDPLQRIEIDALDHPDAMVMQPYTVTWYGGYKGPLVYKLVTGDFAITTRVAIDNASSSGLPGSHYSLAGLMVRAPIAQLEDPENYVFLSLGHGDQNHSSNPGPPPHFEVKTTVDGASNLQLSAAGTLTAQLQIARLGSTIVTLLRRPTEGWSVHQVFQRNFPATMQVGLVAYTDWDKVATYAPSFHNSNVLNDALANDPSSDPNLPFDPDLVAEFDYARFFRPVVPAGIDPATATHGELLSFLGDHVDVPVASYCTAKLNTQGCAPSIGYEGFPSLGGGWRVTASDVLNNKTGLFFYSLAGAQAAPFQGGFLCVKLPTKRTAVQGSGGNPPPNDCSGAFDLDFDAYWQSGVDPALVVGAQVAGQYWSRDPLDPFTTSLTDALSFVLSP